MPNAALPAAPPGGEAVSSWSTIQPTVHPHPQSVTILLAGRSHRPRSGRPSPGTVLAVAVLSACHGPAPTDGRLLQDLPLLEFPATTGPAPPPDLAVFLSGDGGWAALPSGVTRELNAAGVSVVGMDARRYLEEVRTAEDVARDVARVLDTYRRAWSPDRVVLVGFSRGANLAAFAGAGLPDSVRRGLAGIVLLAPGTHEKFRFRLLDLVRTTADPDGRPVPPAVRATAPVPTWCVNGREERARACEDLGEGSSVTVLRLDGGHHLDHAYGALAELVLAGLAGARPGP